MNRRLFMFGVPVSVLVPTIGYTSNKIPESCGVIVSDNHFGRGTVTSPPDFRIEVCLPDKVWESIQPKVESPSKWVFRLVTFDQSGNVRWHGSETIVGQQCRTQSVYKGTYVFVYVTCKSFTGWLTTGMIQHGGHNELQKIDWGVDYRWLDQHFPSKL